MQTRASNTRRGVSVMEVLMSIGIVSVGLLGVVALVPVGGHQANRGFLEDSKAFYGKSAFRQIELRGMADSGDNWKAFTLDLPAPATPIYDRVPHGFCLDPRFIARDGTTDRSAGARFPYRRSDDPLTVGTETDYFAPTASLKPPQPMYRISLKDSNGDALPSAWADLLFQSNDDLRLDKPSDRSLPPVVWDAVGDQGDSSADIPPGPKPWQTFRSQRGTDIGGIDDPALITARQSEGNLSWMATFAPKVGTQDDMYILSVVVFEKRELVEGATINGFTERVVWVADPSHFHGGGFGGGEVTFTPTPGNNGTDLLNEFNDIRAGNWIMLMRKARLSPTEERTVYRWYKVLAADDELVGSSRTFTLDGPDWTYDTTAANTYPTYAVIMPGVVAVYEKIVRLEGSSLFEF